MKKNNLFSFLINPFEKIAGGKALVIGLLFYVLIGFTGALSGVYFDGVFDAHISTSGDFRVQFLCLGLSLLSIVLVFLLAGIIFSKNFRFIDILGTLTLSKAPMLILALAAFIISSDTIAESQTNPFIVLTNPSTLVFLIISLPVMIWNIVLMYNAFKISCNIKNPDNIIIFIVGIILAEALSKILIYWLVTGFPDIFALINTIQQAQ